MSNPTLHIVFSMSAAGSLRRGLTLAGRTEDVTGLMDNWALGPVDSDDIDVRLDAIDAMVEVKYDREEREAIAQFWRTALDTSSQRLVWLSRRSTQEYCGFLEWLRRNGNEPFTLVDLTDETIIDTRQPKRRRPVHCTSILDSEEFAGNELWDRGVSPSPEYLDIFRRLWDRLRYENAPLRVLAGNELQSATIDYFDSDLLSHATADWQGGLYIVGHTMADMAFPGAGQRGVFQCGDEILIVRMRKLIQQRALECRGDPYSRDFKVRRPSPPKGAATEPTV